VPLVGVFTVPQLLTPDAPSHRVVLLAVLVGSLPVDLGEGSFVLFLVGALLYDRSRLRTRLRTRPTR